MGEGANFVAGADIREFGQAPQPPSLPEVCNRIEDCAKPVVAALPNVRVVNQIADIEPDDASWERPRVLWVHHPSDAIGTWQVSNLWRPPGWAEDPAAYDLPPAATWVPFVTFVQESFDLMAGFSATPGFGHDYRTDFVHSWAAIAPPDGWTPSDSDRLRTHLGLDGGP